MPWPQTEPWHFACWWLIMLGCGLCLLRRLGLNVTGWMAWGVTGDIFYFRERFYDNGELSSHLSSDTWHKVSVPSILQYFLRTPPSDSFSSLIIVWKKKCATTLQEPGREGKTGKRWKSPWCQHTFSQLMMESHCCDRYWMLKAEHLINSCLLWLRSSSFRR